MRIMEKKMETTMKGSTGFRVHAGLFKRVYRGYIGVYKADEGLGFRV